MKIFHRNESMRSQTNVNYLPNVLLCVGVGNVFMNKVENKRLKQSALPWETPQSIKFRMYSVVCQLLHAFGFIIHIFVPKTHFKDTASNSGLKVFWWFLEPLSQPECCCRPVVCYPKKHVGWGNRMFRYEGLFLTQKNTFF